MSYHINLDKKSEHQIQKAFDFQLKKVLKLLRNKKITEEKKIHGLRKRFKKIRAFLKLIKYDLKDKNLYKTENNYYKDAAKRFSNARDNVVLHQTFHKIVKKYDLDQNEKPHTLKNLPLSNNSKEFISLKKEIEQKRKKLSVFKLKKKEKPFKTGLKKSYKKLLKKRKKAYTSFSDSDFHEWRKAVKNYMYQMELFHKVLPKKLNKKLKKLKKLADILGFDHDISVLKESFYQHDKKHFMIHYLEKEQKSLRKKASQIRLKGLKWNY
jgi:CHAD domain-containing protein